MAFSIIPLEDYPDQEIHVTVEVDGQNIPLALGIRYNAEGGYWRMRVADEYDGHTLLDGIPLVPGDSPADDLLAPYSYMGLGSARILSVTDTMRGRNPGLSTLTSDFVLVWGDSA